MDKKTGIIIGAIIVVFAALIGISMMQKRSEADYSRYDLNSVIAADENTGGLAENIDGDPEAPV